MGHSFSRRDKERAAGARPLAADLREWIEDFAATHPDAEFADLAAALSAAGYPMPPRDGEERLRTIWHHAEVHVMGRIFYGG